MAPLLFAIMQEWNSSYIAILILFYKKRVLFKKSWKFNGDFLQFKK